MQLNLDNGNYAINFFDPSGLFSENRPGAHWTTASRDEGRRARIYWQKGDGAAF